MATTILNATFDGVTPVPEIGGGTDTWDTGFLGYYSEFESNASNTLQANISLTGGNWTVATMRFGDAAQTNVTNITDLNGNAGRRIDFLSLGHNSDVDLISTRVRFIQGFDGSSHDITLGSENTTAVSLGAVTNTVATGSGYLGSLDIWGGIANVTIGSGGVGSLDLNDGPDSVIANGTAGSVKTFLGNDTVTINAGHLVQFVDMGDDNDTLTVNGANARAHNVLSGFGDDTIILQNGARINSLRDWDGANAVTLSGGSRIEQMFLVGNNTIDIQDSSRIFQTKIDSGFTTMTTGTAWMESITGFNASSDITIGTGGVGQLHFNSDAAQTHTITAAGFIGTVFIHDSGGDPTDDQTTDLTLQDDAGSIRLGNGDNTVTTGSGWVELISTRLGDDTITVGEGGGGLVRTGEGDDLIKVTDLANNTDALIVHGGGGSDTLDFSAVTGAPVYFNLGGAGVFYNVGAINGNVALPPVIGYFSEGNIENLIGTAGKDKFVGDAGGNKLEGRAGNDFLKGQAGIDTLNGGDGSDRIFGGDDKDFIFGGSSRDTINGGAGNDVLRGQNGRDTFVFEAGSDTDQIKDFQDGLDIMRIKDHAGGFGTLGFADVGADREITHDGGVILLSGLAGLVLTGADFDFA